MVDFWWLMHFPNRLMAKSQIPVGLSPIRTLPVAAMSTSGAVVLEKRGGFGKFSFGVTKQLKIDLRHYSGPLPGCSNIAVAIRIHPQLTVEP